MRISGTIWEVAVRLVRAEEVGVDVNRLRDG